MGIAAHPFRYKTFQKQTLKIFPSSKSSISCFVDGYSGRVKNIKKVEISQTNHNVKLGFIQNFETKRILLAEQKI